MTVQVQRLLLAVLLVSPMLGNALNFDLYFYCWSQLCPHVLKEQMMPVH
jgi:hypothetical protein